MTNRKIPFMTIALLLAGCGTTTPVVLDDQMGHSVEMAMAMQTVNPKASLDEGAVETIDGKAAAAVVGRYHKGFERPPVVNIFNLGMGESSGSTLGPTLGGSK
jgi:type IV pilus biogenesis protein CpaD/CtpE